MSGLVASLQSPSVGIVDPLSSPRSSGPTVSIVSTSPGRSEILARSPSTLSVTFDRPVDSFSIGTTDFELVHLAPDGTTRPLSVGEATLAESADPSDSSGSRVSLRLSEPLADGQYRLRLLGGNRLQGLDGSPLAGDGSDRNLSEFRVGMAGVGLSDAVDLGSPTSKETIRPGSLDLAADPHAVDLYKVTLPAGHSWQLVLEVSSYRDGAALGTSLSLFDAGGNLISTDSLGRPDFTADPYLFAGLAPGTYYVGVSGKGNVPGTPNGYDPSRSSEGTSDRAQEGGTYRLHVVADVADRPVRVIGSRIDHADPDSSVPTGLTVEFSGAIRADRLKDTSRQAARLVDQAGRSWSLTPIAYDESRARLSFAFDRALPAGRYSLQVGDPGLLVDLAGHVPSAPGLPSGVLRSFDVNAGSLQPDDLGPIRPDDARTGFAAKISIDGTSAVAQFTVIVPGYYSIQGVNGPLTATVAPRGASRSILELGGAASGTRGGGVYLDAGVYTLTLNAPGDRPAGASITITRKQTLLSELIVGGVAQGPALAMRLVSPSELLGPDDGGSIDANPGPGTSALAGVSTGGAPATPAPSSGTDPRPAPAAMISGPTGNPASPGSSHESGMTGTIASGSAAPGGPASAFLANATGPVGYPSSQSDHVGVVGPTGLTGSVALASNSAGLPQGLFAIEKPAAPAGRPRPGRARDDLGVGSNPTELTGVDPALDYGLIVAELDRGEPDGTRQEAGWIDRFLASTFGSPQLPSDPDDQVQAGADVMMLASPGGREATPPEADRMEAASFASPVGIGLLTVIAYRYRRQIFGQFPGARKRDFEVRRNLFFHGCHRPARAGNRRPVRMTTA